MDYRQHQNITRVANSRLSPRDSLTLALATGVMPMNRIAIILGLTLLVGCTDSGYVASNTSNEIYSELKANNFESLDLSKFGGSDWKKVCFLGPYNEMSEKALGFNWQVSKHTDVLKSDGHNVIVFASESEVLEYVVHSRSKGDFWQLSGKCFNRKNANFIKGSGGDFVRPKA